MKQRMASNKLKQRQLQTKFLQEQTKKMQQKLSQLKKQVQEQRQLKATTNFQSTVTRWKKTTRSDAPLKSYAKQVLQQQKQAYKKFGIDQKKITGTKTFSTIKRRIKQEKEQQQQKNPTKIATVLSKTMKDNSKEDGIKQLPVETIQNNFFKAKIDVKNLIKEKTVLEFLEEIFLQQYNPLFAQNNITQLGDLRFLTQQQLSEMAIPKGHQVKILKRIKEQFDKSKSPTKIPLINIDKSFEEQEKPAQKVSVQMGYGDGDVNDYAYIQAKQNQSKRLEQNFHQINSQNVSENEEDDIVMITVPLSQIALQTGQQGEDGDQLQNSMAENCFNCYKAIPLSNQLFQSPDNRNFCSANCLKMYKLQMQKTCPQCGKEFFKTSGYYEQGLWFCSIGCCPNKDDIQEMFLEWTRKDHHH